MGVFSFTSAFAFGVVTDERHASIETTATVYTWQQNATGDWQSPSNWMPARTTPAPNDILVFNSGGTTTATNVPTETIGQLMVSGNTSVNLQSNNTAILTIGGGDGEDLSVENNSALNFNGPNAVTINLVSSASAAISGTMAFFSSTMAAHRLLASDANAVTFDNGAVFTAGIGFTGNPFGTTNLNSVSFESGSTYVCLAGGDPFGATQPASVVVFNEGSLFSLRGNAQTSFFSGRTYANFELNYPGGIVFAGGTSPLTTDDLTITAGELYLEVASTGNSVRGDILTQLGTRLIMQSGIPQTITLNGKNPQTITIRGSVGVNPANTVAIDNPSGVTVTTEQARQFRSM